MQQKKLESMYEPMPFQILGRCAASDVILCFVEIDRSGEVYIRRTSDAK